MLLYPLHTIISLRDNYCPLPTIIVFCVNNNACLNEPPASGFVPLHICVSREFIARTRLESQICDIRMDVETIDLRGESFIQYIN